MTTEDKGRGMTRQELLELLEQVPDTALIYQDKINGAVQPLRGMLVSTQIELAFYPRETEAAWKEPRRVKDCETITAVLLF